LRFGVGVKSLFPTGGSGEYSKVKFSYLPIYFTFKINPFVKSNKIFVKGDIGFDAYFSSDLKDYTTEDPSGETVKHIFTDNEGIYYAFGVGYEFSNGLIVGMTYGIYASSVGLTEGRTSTKYFFTYKCVSLNFGYKFKI
jgi:hypothetical protein